MFFKNLKYAFRNLMRDKFYTFLNGISLTVGMTVALLISMWIQHEVSYDNYHSKNGQNYRVLSSMSFAGERYKGIATPAPLQKAAAEKIPEIQHIARVWEKWNTVLSADDFLIKPKHACLADPSIFEILDFDFIHGDAKTALSNLNNIVLSESLAAQIFGKEDPIGKNLKLDDKLDLQVVAIIKDSPRNAHLKVDCIIPFEKNITQFMSRGSLHWGSNNFYTYTLLHPNSDVAQVSQKLTDLLPVREDTPVSERRFLDLQPIQDIYLGSNDLSSSAIPSGDWTYIRLMGLIGLIILFIASINYVNLTTARAAHRAKNTGIRKIVGASRSQLISQHILEAVALVGVCSLGALFLSYLSLPFFEKISGATIPASIIFSIKTISLLGLIAFVTVLLSGIQPAFQLSAFHPVNALKGSQFKGVSGKGRLRKALVVTQFVSSAALIICTVFMLRQLDFIQTAKLGYEKEHIFSFHHDEAVSKELKESLKQQSEFQQIAMSDQSIVNVQSQMGDFDWEGKDAGTPSSICQIIVDDGFQNLFDLKLIEGRWFRPGDNDEESFLINESAVKALKLENPIGKWIDFWGTRGTIVGVVKDFHFKSFHNNIEQLIFRQNPKWLYRTYIKTTGKNAKQAIATAETIYKQHHPNDLFEYEFLDETYNNLYKTETRISQLFMLFALIAIIISCLGIFGLSTYTAERRFKEIGIRKVLGASLVSIIQLLSKDFLQLVVFALVIAIPIAWYFMDGWLNNFAYHIKMDWWIFGLASVLLIGIAFITVLSQSLRAALNNPVDALKNE